MNSSVIIAQIYLCKSSFVIKLLNCMHMHTHTLRLNVLVSYIVLAINTSCISLATVVFVRILIRVVISPHATSFVPLL